MQFSVSKYYFYLQSLVSGSPVIQDGMLVGVVTHVLVNDPTRGYGIFAQTMLETAENLDGTEMAG